MLVIPKYAAIDIGSNAMRLLIMMVINDGGHSEYKKVSLIRLPIRLGHEAFTQHVLSESTMDMFLEGMKAFEILMRIHKVIAYKAVATSAMRELKNGDLVVKRVKEHTGLDLSIIDGAQEAELLSKSHFKNNAANDRYYVYVDVGGGSTEITIMYNRSIVSSRSFKIGTIRMLNHAVSKDLWKEMKDWVKLQTHELRPIEMVGSGGNINKVYKLLEIEYPKPIAYHQLKMIKRTLSKLSYNQRIKIYALNSDRADVIVPATKIYFSIMKWSNCIVIQVPKIGLSDGVIQVLYEKNN